MIYVIGEWGSSRTDDFIKALLKKTRYSVTRQSFEMVCHGPGRKTISEYIVRRFSSETNTAIFLVEDGVDENGREISSYQLILDCNVKCKLCHFASSKSVEELAIFARGQLENLIACQRILQANMMTPFSSRK